MRLPLPTTEPASGATDALASTNPVAKAHRPPATAAADALAHPDALASTDTDCLQANPATRMLPDHDTHTLSFTNSFAQPNAIALAYSVPDLHALAVTDPAPNRSLPVR